MFTLNAQARTDKDNVAFMRKQGKMPAVFYGLDKKTTSVSIDEIEFKKLWKKAGESSTVTLETPDGKVETLIHDVSFDPVSGQPLHADFLVIDTKKVIQVAIPLVFTGVSAAVKAGGILVKVLHDLEVEGLPGSLPHEITVDISTLTGNDSNIAVKDLALPTGVKAMAEPEEIVASIAVQQEEVETAAPVDLSAIEVEKKGKKEEEAPAAE